MGLTKTEGFTKNQSPVEIVNTFLEQYTAYRTEQEQLDLLFRFVQYAERQVVLFDALEDADIAGVKLPIRSRWLPGRSQAPCTTGAVAKTLHRHFIGIEREPGGTGLRFDVLARKW